MPQKTNLIPLFAPGKNKGIREIYWFGNIFTKSRLYFQPIHEHFPNF